MTKTPARYLSKDRYDSMITRDEKLKWLKETLDSQQEQLNELKEIIKVIESRTKRAIEEIDSILKKNEYILSNWIISGLLSTQLVFYFCIPIVTILNNATFCV
jgi:hypothetical protein